MAYMEAIDVSQVESFSPKDFEKTNLFETENFFCDIYCFEEGQTQEPHEHGASDKVYSVLEGEVEVTVGDETKAVDAGGTVLAPSGERHGVEALERSRLLVFMAPHPAHVDEHSHGHGDEDDGRSHDHGHGVDESFDLGFLTVSSSRGEAEDESGGRAKTLVEGSGHRFAAYDVVSDDEDEISEALTRMLEDADAVVTSGGTGLTDDDVTVEVARSLFDREVPGFGEEFRRRSVDDVGTAAMLSRATMGVVDDSVVFVLPGSVDAVETGMELLLPELGHALGLVRRER